MLQLEGHGGSGHPGQRRLRLPGWSPSTCWTTCAPPSPGRTGRAPGSICPSRPSPWSRRCALFTSDAAWASRDEAVRGTLELGKQADLVVLDRDLFKISHQDFNRVKVLETVLNGVTVYRAETL